MTTPAQFLHSVQTYNPKTSDRRQEIRDHIEAAIRLAIMHPVRSVWVPVVPFCTWPDAAIAAVLAEYEADGWRINRSDDRYFVRLEVPADVRADAGAPVHSRPSVLYRPSLGLDGNQWCALYGANLMEGVSGFGPSPEAAMAAFDRAWLAELPTT